MPFARTALISLLPVLLLFLTLTPQASSAADSNQNQNQNQKVLQNDQHIPKLAASATNAIIGLAGDKLIDEPLSYAHMGDQIHACAELMCPRSLISEYEFFNERNNHAKIENKSARMACVDYIQKEMTVEERRGNKWYVCC